MIATYHSEVQEHVSYSGITAYIGCGEKYRLTKMKGVREVGAYWSVGGSAVHEATEALDRAGIIPTRVQAVQAFTEAFERIKAEAIISTSGKYELRMSKNQGDAWWRKAGPEMVERWFDFKAESNMKIWTLPDGEPAIEVSITERIGGVLVKAYIDRVMVTPKGHLAVVDLKTGARKPATYLQLGFYALLLEKKYEIRPSVGGYWMARTCQITELMSLAKYDERYLSRFTQGLQKARNLGLFLPNVSSFCISCGVSYACWAVDGSEARRYE